jgi:hypothetical protein
MTVTLHLRPEVEAGLLAQARASGLTVEEFLLSVVEGAVLSAAQETQPREVPEDRAEAVRRMLEFGEKHRLSLGVPITRALLHEGHRF